MKKLGWQLVLGVLALPLAGCAMSPPLRAVPTYDVRAREPASTPAIPIAAAQLVPYPDLDVQLVVSEQAEIYHCRGLFFCIEDGRWFYAPGLTGTWNFIETKYVPPDLFRARGHFPPGVDEAALIRARRSPSSPTPPVAVRN